eukprot:762686-Hanusia_phi.AAC.3
MRWSVECSSAMESTEVEVHIDCNSNGNNGIESSDFTLEAHDTDDVEINHPLSINYLRRERKLPQRLRIGNEVLGVGEKIYPFTYAELVEQNDIMDEGTPPQARSGPVPSHRNLVITLKSAIDLPRTDLGGKCDCFCKFFFKNQEQHSSVKFNALDCVWNESFEFFVHEHHFNEALRRCDEESTNVTSSDLTISVYDWDSFRTEFIGNVALDLTRIIPFQGTELDLKLNIMSRNGETVIGASGRATQIHVGLAIFPLQKLSCWKMPTLADTLQAIEGGVHLKAAVKEQSSVIASSTSSTAFDFVGAKLNDVFLEWEEMIENEKDDFNFWKETLAKAIESLWVNAIILALVVTDVINVLLFAFDSTETNHETPVQIAINVSVGFLFVLELSLRQLALGKRFWLSIWNIFDFVVIWFSAVAVTSRLLYEAGAFNRYIVNGTNPASGLRILSRVAVGARVLRILISIHRARMISGAVNQKLRTA